MERGFPYYPVFVYGSLMSGFDNFNKLFSHKLEYIFSGEFKNGVLVHYKDDIPKPGQEKGFTDIIESGFNSEPIYGELLYIKKNMYRQVIKKMDKLIGSSGCKSSNNLYNRCVRDITKIDGSVVKAWMYFGTYKLHINKSYRKRLVIYNCNNWKKYLYSLTDKDDKQNYARLYPYIEVEEAM